MAAPIAQWAFKESVRPVEGVKVKKWLWIPVVALPVVGLGDFVVSRRAPPPGTPIHSCRAVVDGLVSLQEPHRVPQLGEEREIILDETFDVEDYFSALTHLSMEEGYDLCYVYYANELCGEPILDAGKAGEGGHCGYVRISMPPKHLSCMGDPHEDEPESPRHEYLSHIEVDGTEEGYIEYVVLYIMGERFFQHWHALYNDYTVICDPESLDDSLTAAEDQCLFANFTRWLGRISHLKPRVELEKDTVRVRLAVFSRLSGFNEEIFTLRRSFRHTILQREVKPLAPTMCPFLY